VNHELIKNAVRKNLLHRDHATVPGREGKFGALRFGLTDLDAELLPVDTPGWWTRSRFCLRVTLGCEGIGMFLPLIGYLSAHALETSGNKARRHQKISVVSVHNCHTSWQRGTGAWLLNTQHIERQQFPVIFARSKQFSGCTAVPMFSDRITRLFLGWPLTGLIFALSLPIASSAAGAAPPGPTARITSRIDDSQRVELKGPGSGVTFRADRIAI
jgi:hypothetical protein